MLGLMRTFWVGGATVCPARVEVDIYRGLPTFCLAGTPRPVARRIRERLREAFASCGFKFPLETIRVTLAPATRCMPDPTWFHLPLATALLLASAQMEQGRLSASAMVGELAPDGSVHGVPDVWAIAEAAVALQLVERLVVPAENEADAAVFKGIEVAGVESLRQVPALASA